MKITSLVENTSAVGYPVEHGLSLYIQLECGQQLLFDMGQRCLFAENAKKAGLNIADIDLAIISHGHYDHGGGLRTFLNLNRKATVYLHQQAFQPHYSLRDSGLRYIGLETDLRENPRLHPCTDLEKISPELTLFAGVTGTRCCPRGNQLLFGPSQTQSDCFPDEQNLLIQEGRNLVLLAGCAHKGIVNIMQRVQEVSGRTPTHVLAGMHLVKSVLNPEEETSFIKQLANELKACPDTHFYTMHCTGTEAYLQLKEHLGRHIDYLSCGEQIEI